MNYNFTNVATLKYNFDMYSSKFKLGNEALLFEIGIKPPTLNTVDATFSAKHSSKYEPTTGKYEATLGFKYGSPMVGPLRFWPTVSTLPFYSRYGYFIISNFPYLYQYHREESLTNLNIG